MQTYYIFKTCYISCRAGLILCYIMVYLMDLNKKKKKLWDPKCNVFMESATSAFLLFFSLFVSYSVGFVLAERP